ncbi:MAG: NfeD family protein [Bacteroidota bacterium]
MKKVERLRLLIGKRGVTLCTLRPAGFVKINGEVFDCQGVRPFLIQKGTNVIVTGVLMNHFLLVREIDV